MILTEIDNWHKAARPNPTGHDFNVTVGVHLEEVGEMLMSLSGKTPEADDELFQLEQHILAVATRMKGCHVPVEVKDCDRKDLLDSLADQIVTAVGVGHCASMNTVVACERVNRSNWSKAVDGKFIRNADGKIIKPDSYVPPDLEGLF